MPLLREKQANEAHSCRRLSWSAARKAYWTMLGVREWRELCLNRAIPKKANAAGPGESVSTSVYSL